MNYALIHCNQAAYVALSVRFDGNAKDYLYKAEASDNWKEGDHAIVLVDSRQTDKLQVVVVTRVYQNPIEALDPDHLYKWVVQKVNLAAHSSRTLQQERMVEQLRVWESAERMRQMTESMTKMVAALPGGEESLKRFQSLGIAAPIEVKL